MSWLRVVLLNIFIIKLSLGLNPLLQPIAVREVEEKWCDNLRLQIIELLNQHRVANQYQNNDMAFLQFGNDSAGFIDQLFKKLYQQFNDRAIIMTQVPLLMDNVVFKKSSLMVMFVCHYDKKEFQKFLKEIQLSVFWDSVKPILVIPTFQIATNNYNWFKYIFGFFKYEYLFNVGIIYYSRRYDRIERIGYNPFASDPIIIEPRYLFTNKVKNLNGYEIKITQFDDPPRSVFDQNEGIVNGMDGLILYTVCKYMNASCRVMETAGGHETSYSNVVFDLVTRRADINFNHRLFWSENYLNSIVIPIYPYEHANIVLMVPSPQPVLPYRHFIDAFGRELWILIAFNFVLFTGMWFAVNSFNVLKNRSDIVDICLDLVRMHLALPLPRVITHFRERRIFWIISMYTFIVFQAYQTKLTSYLMSRRYMPNYQTIAEVNDSNLEIVLSKNYQMLVNHFLDKNPMKNKQLDIDLSIWLLKNALLENEGHYNSRQAFFVTQQQSDLFKYSALNKIDDEFILEPIKEKILASVASYTVPKNSPFEVEISDIIRRIQESGLYDYFKVIGFFNVRQHFNLTAQIMVQTNTRPSRVQLSLRVFMPILHMFATGSFLSLGCFLLEYLSPRMLISATWIKRRLRTLQIRATLKRWIFRFILYLLKD